MANSVAAFGGLKEFVVSVTVPLATCTVYATLYRMNPLGLTYAVESDA
jgi:hypothetical protein